MLMLNCDYGGMTQTTPPPRQIHTVDRDAFRLRLQYTREASGLSKAAFGESIGLSKSNYGQVEAGNRLLTVDQIYNLFMIHGVPMEYLVAGREPTFQRSSATKAPSQNRELIDAFHWNASDPASDQQINLFFFCHLHPSNSLATSIPTELSRTRH